MKTATYSISEQLLLLGLSEDGALDRLHQARLDYAIAGASLVDLSFAGRIDTDFDHLFVTSAEPIGDPLLDGVLERIVGGEADRPTLDWVLQIAEYAHELREARLKHLRARTVVRERGGHAQIEFRWSRDPQLSPEIVTEIRDHVVGLLRSHEIPAPEDAALASLARASGILDLILSRTELKQLEPRALRLAKLDLIGRQVNHALDEAIAS